MAGIGILIFTPLFNLMISSGTSKAAIMMPLLTPNGDICGWAEDKSLALARGGNTLVIESKKI